MAESLSQAGAYSIKILEGQNANQVINLIGRSLPYWGLKFETEQRVKTTYYPGNPIATQQVMGPIEKPTVITGMWKDIFLGDGVARQFVDTFDLLVRTGVSVEVSWGTGYRPTPDGGSFQTTSDAIVRTGIVKRISHTYDRPQDISWEIELEWRGRPKTATPPALRAGYEDPREGFVGLAITFDETKSEIEAFGDVFGYATNLSYAFQDAADDVQNVLVNSISTLNSATDTLSGSQDLTLDVVARVRGVAQETITALDRFTLAILTFPLYLTEVRDDALSFLALKSSLFDLLRQTDLARTGAIENE